MKKVETVGALDSKRIHLVGEFRTPVLMKNQDFLKYFKIFLRVINPFRVKNVQSLLTCFEPDFESCDGYFVK